MTLSESGMLSLLVAGAGAWGLWGWQAAPLVIGTGLFLNYLIVLWHKCRKEHS